MHSEEFLRRGAAAASAVKPSLQRLRLGLEPQWGKPRAVPSKRRPGFGQPAGLEVAHNNRQRRDFLLQTAWRR